MKRKVRGIVIKENQYGESNRVITVLSAEEGIIRAFVHGASSLKNRSVTATSLLSYSVFSLTKTGDTYRVDESSAEEIFFDLRSDIQKVSLAQYFCELFAYFAPEEQAAEEYLRLMLNALALLCRNDKDIRIIKTTTELYLMKLCGYMPEIECCAECGECDGTFHLDSAQGVLLCDSCKTPSSVIVPASVLSAMRHVLYSPFERIFRFKLSDPMQDIFSKQIEHYLLFRAERRFKTLDFYHQMSEFSGD